MLLIKAVQIEHPLKHEEWAPALMGTEGAAKVWHLSSSDDPAEDYQLSALQWKDLSLPQPTGEEKKQFRDAGDVSSHGFPHREERKGKNDKETHPFRDQQSARY